MIGALALLLALGSGCALARRTFSLRVPVEVAAVGLGLGLSLFLFWISLFLRCGMSLRASVFLAPLAIACMAALGSLRPDAERQGPRLSFSESAAVLSAVLGIWLFTNMAQVITVDDDYWLHTPVQGRMLRGIIPPTNPFFPDLVLGGHFGRDLLVVSTSLLTGRNVFGAQVLLTSFCQSLSLALLYLALRRSGSAAEATGATALGWLGVNVAHRCGLVDFFQNNGAPTYLLLALLLYLFCELWRQPGRKLALLSGIVLGVYALVYETHFGLVVLTVLAVQILISPPARRASMLALAVAATLSVSGGGALSHLLSRDTAAMEDSVANQSQTVRLAFPKSPFLHLRMEVGEIDPVSCGYRVGMGIPLLKMVDHVPGRSDPRYVSLWSWNVMRMHWLAVWLAPLTGWLLWRSRHRAGQFMWLFGAWAFLVPGMVDFGPIHEFEWYRWEFAAGFGFATALGVSLGSFVRSRRGGLALLLALALIAHAGLDHVRRYSAHLDNPGLTEVLGLRFDSTDWLLRHGDSLRFKGSDLRSLAWIAANPAPSKGCLVVTTGTPEPWGIMFESTAMALADIQVLGHLLPPPSDPVGVPPFRLNGEVTEFLAQPTLERADRLGIQWILLRSDDPALDARMARQFRLVYCDDLASDGRRRLLFTRERRDGGELRPPMDRLRATTLLSLELTRVPEGSKQIQVSFIDAQDYVLGRPSLFPLVERVTMAAPAASRLVELRLLGDSGQTLRLSVFPTAPVVKDPPAGPAYPVAGARTLGQDQRLR